MRTHREEVVCNNCDGEFFIEYTGTSSELKYCPFCAEKLDDDSEQWDDDDGWVQEDLG